MHTVHTPRPRLRRRRRELDARLAASHESSSSFQKRHRSEVESLQKALATAQVTKMDMRMSECQCFELVIAPCCEGNVGCETVRAPANGRRVGCESHIVLWMAVGC